MIELTPIGQVESELTDRALAPKQGFEGAPDAWLVFEPSVLDGLEGIAPGAEVIVLTWLHRADRDVLRVHPRDDVANPLTGVFSTRSADRPNPIGLHPVQVVAVEGARVRVRSLEAVDGTPIVDVKPVLQRGLGDERRRSRRGRPGRVRGQPLHDARDRGRAGAAVGVAGVVRARGLRRALLDLSPQARHSRNLAARPQVSIVVFDSQVPVGSAAAVYMRAVAVELEGVELEQGMEVFARENTAQGIDRGPRRRDRARAPPAVPRRRDRALGARPARRAAAGPAS